MVNVTGSPYRSWNRFIEAYSGGDWDGTLPLPPPPPPAPSILQKGLSDEATSSANSNNLRDSDDTVCDLEVVFAETGFLSAPHSPRERERLKALHRFGAVHRRLDQNFDRIAHLAKDILKCKWGLINLMDEEEGYFNHDTGLPFISSPRKVSLCAHTILQNGGRPMIISDSRKDWRFRNHPFVEGPLKLMFYAGVPLVSEGMSIGSLCVLDDQPHPDFKEMGVEILQGLASVVVRELQMWQDKQEIRTRERIQEATERFAVDCLKESGPLNENIEATTLRLCQRAADLIKDTLEIEGALILNISDTNMGANSIRDASSNSEASPRTSAYLIRSNDEETEGSPYEECRFPVNESGLSSHFTQNQVDSSTFGATVDDRGAFQPSSGDRPKRRLSSFMKVKLLSSMSVKSDGEIYDESQIPSYLRPLMPANTRYAMAVPVFDTDEKPFALFSAYSTTKTQRVLNGYELQFLRGLGVIIGNDILKRMTALADQSKSRFISNISHELRTPLHGILAAAELLAETEVTDAQSVILRTVQACGNSLVETVGHVLDFSKLTTRDGHMERVTVDLLQLVEETVESSWVGSVARRFGNFDIGDAYSPRNWELPDLVKNVEALIHVDLRPNAWTLKCEKGGLRRILVNLLSNSFKFTNNGFVRVSLKEIDAVDVSPNHAVLELSVLDTGKGINEAYLKDFLFKPYSQEDSGLAGAGLGLAIIRNIVESDGVKGKIEVKSSTSPGSSGTEIRVTFEAERQPPSSPTLGKALYNSRFPSARIRLLGFNMERIGHRALQEDLSFYLQNLWHASVVSDVKESNILIVNGDASLLGTLCDAEGVKRPLIFLSTSRQHSALTETIQSVHALGGMLRVVFKPCRPSHLFDAVRDCLGFLGQTATIETDPHYLQPSPSTSSFPPQACSPSCPIQPPSPPQPFPSRLESGTVLKVLVVEDNHVNRALLTQWLRKKQHLYDEAENGQEAVDKFEARGPNYYDVILMDISMPVLDGIGSTRAIRALEAQWRQQEPSLEPPESSVLDSDSSSSDFSLRSSHIGTYILILSGLTTPDDKVRALNAGVNGYLTKPVAFRTLAAIFAKL